MLSRLKRLLLHVQAWGLLRKALEKVKGTLKSSRPPAVSLQQTEVSRGV